MQHQLRDFAERVLFATTLEEKLAPPPAGLVDTAPGTALDTPPAPGRPGNLLLAKQPGRAQVPSTREIHDGAHRGQLLHFFANHELLATELMALVLLKFPDAPPEFRRGVLDTLKEEQMHTKLYIRRMADCGVTLGDHPVNGFFWNAVAPMPSPLDYVTRLSLTFEQANLDYSRHFASVFGAAGDTGTAAVLDRIYHDEINHVGYGLHWFRQWKNPALSDWDAFRERLDLPLSAARAKGAEPFNTQGRADAGLDADFIRHLRVYSQSRGRTPNVFFFNPDAEAFALDPHHQPENATLDLQHDLATLPAFLAHDDDVVLVPELPSPDFLTTLKEHGLPVPEFVKLDDLQGLHTRKLNALRPWAWSPDAVNTLTELPTSQPRPAAPPSIFSKESAVTLFPDLISSPFAHLLTPPGHAPRRLTGVDQLPTHRPLLLKAPYSTTGRDRHRLLEPDPTPDQLAWLERTLRRHGAVIAEPWFDRRFDFSVHFDLAPDGNLRRRGLVHLDNTPRGQFRAASVPPRFTDGLPDDLRRHLYQHSPTPRRSWLDAYIDDTLAPALTQHLTAANYHGPVGVDAFFHAAPDGTLLLHPLSEINPRYTMGRVALELARHTPQQKTTTLALAFRGEAPPAAGTLALNDPATARRFIATLSLT